MRKKKVKHVPEKVSASFLCAKTGFKLFTYTDKFGCEKSEIRFEVCPLSGATFCICTQLVYFEFVLLD